MSSYDNPAGRLHALLKRLSEQKPEKSLAAAWSTVLGVPKHEVALHLGGVGQLVGDIQIAVKQSYPAASPTVNRYQSMWSSPIFPFDQSLNSPLSGVMPDGAALEALAMISAHLHEVAPEGTMPDEAELQEFKDTLRGLLEDLKATEDLPEELKQEIAARLLDIQHAIEHIEVGGPNAVRRAMEALLGSVVAYRDPEAFKKPVFSRIRQFCIVAWVAFTTGATIQNSIEAWTGIVGELPEAVDVIVDAQVVDEAPKPEKG